MNFNFTVKPPVGSEGAPPPLKLQVASPPPNTKQCSYDGATYNFIDDPPHKFVCSICTQLVKDPHLTACCGHEFCEKCLKEWEKTSTTGSCPHCRQERFVHILDKATRREVDELKLNCPKQSHGCEWQGELGMIKFHEKDCSYVSVKCQNCSSLIPRKDLEQHVTSTCPFRESKCVYCDKRDAYFKVISFVHLAECPGYPLDCPNKCGTTGISRAKISAHRQACPLEETECPLKAAGCSQKLLRKDLPEHVVLNQADHLLKLMIGFQTSQQELQTQQREVRKLRVFQATTSEVMERISANVDQLLAKSLTTELGQLRSISALLGSPRALVLDSERKEISLLCPNYTRLEKRQTRLWESLPFYVAPGYKLRLVLRSGLGKSREVAPELQLLVGEFDGELPWPCSINLGSLYLSVKRVEGASSKGKTVFDPTTGAQCPFSLALRGKGESSVPRLTSPASHQILWHTDKLMDALPPSPSAIRAQYLENDCLTVNLSWSPMQHSLSSLESTLQKLSIKGDQPFSAPTRASNAGGYWSFLWLCCDSVCLQWK